MPKSKIVSNFKLFKKNLEKDFQSVLNSQSATMKQLVDIGFQEIEKSAIIEARAVNTRYPEHPKANKPDGRGQMKFHKSKIMSRRGTIHKHWKPLTWSVNTQGEWKGNNGILKADVKSERAGYVSTILIPEPLDKFYKGLHYGFKNKPQQNISLNELKEQMSNKRKGQRRVISNKLKRGVNLFNRIAKKELSKVKSTA